MTENELNKIINGVVEQLQLKNKNPCPDAAHNNIIVEHSEVLVELREGQKYIKETLGRMERKFNILFEKHDAHNEKLNRHAQKLNTLEVEKKTTKGNIAIIISGLCVVWEAIKPLIFK